MTSGAEKISSSGSHGSNVSGVTTLETDVGTEVYRELLEAFLTLLSVQLVDLSTAVAQRDVSAAQFVCHQIKGTASSFGAMRLDELANGVMQLDDTGAELLGSLVGEIATEVSSFAEASASESMTT